MPFTVIQRGIFWSEIVCYGIARRKPAAHFLDAGLASFGSGVCGKVHAIFIVFFIK